MTLQQLACFCALVDHDFRVARTALALHTTQPAVSKVIRALEEEVGGVLFQRRGNRLTGLTDAGQEVWRLARRAVHSARDITSVLQRHEPVPRGVLRVGTTHIHARYALLPVARLFGQCYPDVSLDINLGASAQIVDWVEQGAVDIGLSTLAGEVPAAVAALEAYDIERCVIAAPGHPLVNETPLTLEKLARHPLIVYDEQFSSGQVVMEAFRRRGLSPKVVLRASEAGVIKAYVAAGLGIAVIQRRAVDPAEDANLCVLSSGDLFATSTAYLTIRRDHYPHSYLLDFIRQVSPRWRSAGLEALLADGVA